MGYTDDEKYEGCKLMRIFNKMLSRWKFQHQYHGDKESVKGRDAVDFVLCSVDEDGMGNDKHQIKIITVNEERKTREER